MAEGRRSTLDTTPVCGVMAAALDATPTVYSGTEYRCIE
jgi:hypothetical protein